MEDRCLLSASLNAGQVVSASGVSEVGGRDLYVEVFVWVPEGGDAAGIARDALLQQGARPVESASFSTTGLVWSQFFDTAQNNDFVVQHYNPSNDPLGGAGESVLVAAQQTWNDVATSSFTFSLGDTNITREPSLVRESRGRQYADGNNDVAWMSLGGQTTLGVAWYDISAQEADVALNTNFAWSTNGSGIDAQTVLLHELGHVLGLGHSSVSGSVMEAVYAGMRRDLHADDIAGISTLYPADVTPPGNPPQVDITSPAANDVFDSGASISFAGVASDAEDGDLTSTISWTSSIEGLVGTGGGIVASLSDGTHVITASVTDSDGNTTTETVTVTVGNPQVATSVVVTSVTYATEGGKDSNRHLLVTFELDDNLGNAVAGATVGVVIYRNGVPTWQAVGTTGADGTVTFSIKNAPPGTYYTGAYQIVAGALNWDGVTPFNEYSKSSNLSTADVFPLLLDRQPTPAEILASRRSSGRGD